MNQTVNGSSLYKQNKKAYNSFVKYLIKEDKKTENKDKRNIARKKIINYVLNHPVTSKAELAKELNLSMPTVLANVNDLLEKRLLEEMGEYASTGGRKAKSIGINKSYCHAMGLLITANHIEMVLVNLGDEIIKKDRIRLKFTAELSYCTEVAQKV
ncbi:MAG: winged helix-turn-helix domain-containing protein, partial [Roseburia sp.]|nr:winged helix-turn-helix domain-containing protein [Roseburia sp.]